MNPLRRKNAAGGSGSGSGSGSRRGLRHAPPHLPGRRVARPGVSAFLLEECLIYLVVSSVLLGLAFASFYRVMENAKNLRRNAADITRVLQAGERWRQDVHQAVGPVRLVSPEDATSQALHVPQTSGEVIYFFTGTNMLRSAATGAPWIEVLSGVKRSRLVPDSLDRVVAWRWELELSTGRKKPLVRPLFTFLAAAPARENP